MILRLDAKKLADTAGLLASLGETFGFTVKNRDALVDMLTHLDDSTRGSLRVQVFPGEIVLLAIDGSSPQVKQLQEIAAAVNWRRLEAGEPPILAIACEP